MNLSVRKEPWIDILKGIGIILVVFGHALTKDIAKTSTIWWVIRNAVYMVHMPLFFICGGFLFERNRQKYCSIPTAVFLKDKMRSYGVPYLSFMFFAYLVEAFFAQFEKTKSLFEAAGYYVPNVFDFICSLVTYKNPVDNHLWFSYVMLLVLLISFLCKGMKLKRLLLFSTFFYLLTWLFSFPKLIWKTFRYFFLFQVGRMLFCVGVKNIEKNKIVFSLTAFITSFSAWLVLRKRGIYVPQSLVQMISEISGVILLIKVSFCLSGKVKLLEHLGARTYPIYLMHQPFLVPFCTLALKKLGCPWLLSLIVTTVIGISIPYALDRFVIQKSNFLKYVLLGENPTAKSCERALV